MDAVLALHHSVDDQDRLPVGDLAIAVVDVGFDRHVDLAELILEGEETNLLRRARSLAGDDQPRDPHRLVVPDRWEPVAFQRAHLAQAVAAKVDEVVAGREIGDPVLELVGVEIVDVRQGGRGPIESQLGLFVDAAPETFAVPPFLPSPEQLATRLLEAVKGPHHDQVADRLWTDRTAAKAAEKVVEGFVGSLVGAFVDDRLATLFTEVADVVETDAHGIASSAPPPGGFAADLPGERGGETLGYASDVGAVDVER